MGCTAEDLRNQLLCYWAVGSSRGIGPGQPLRLQVPEGSEVTNSRTGQLLGPGANDRGGGRGAGVSPSGKRLGLVRREERSS